jgi:hypothetical protein
MKKLLRRLIVLVVLIIAACVVALFYVDVLVKRGVEYGATYALGVKTTLDAVNVGILSGQSLVSALKVANPGGFESDHFLTMQRGEAAVAIVSLLKSEVEVPKLLLDEIDLNLEKRNGKANYRTIMDSLARFEKGEAAERSRGKRLLLRELMIRNVTVNVDLLPVGGELTRQKIVIPEIRLTDVGSDTDKGVIVAELVDIVFKAIVECIIESDVELPVTVLNELSRGLEGLASIGQLGLDVAGTVTSSFIQLTETVGETARGIRETAGGIVEDIVKGVEDVVGIDEDGEGDEASEK